MIFSLEALRARHGDSLLLHYGSADAPRVSLIDGGPRGVYGETLKPRLEALAAALRDTGKLGADDPLELDLVMVSHIDDDHVGGLLALTDELVEDKDRGREPWVAPKTLWHNTFEDVAGDDAVEADLPPAEVPSEGADAGAVLASVGQARRLRANAELL